MVTLLQGETINLQQEGVEIFGIGKGRIYLTDKRVIFESMSGFIFKRTKTALVVNLSDINNVETQGNNIIIDTATSKHILSSKDSINLANHIKKEITSRVSEVVASRELEARSVSSPPPPLTDFCPFCGAKLASVTIYCENCGKRVK